LISSVSWNNRNDTLSIGLDDGEIQLWDVSTTKKIRSITQHSSRVCSMDWSKESNIMLSGSRDAQLLSHDIRKRNSIITSFNGHSSEVSIK
jgi:WD40 repeat protein